MIPALLAWSGGKDSAWALHALRGGGEVQVVGLLTTLAEGFERASMQGIRREVLHAQADAAGLPLLEAWIPQLADNGAYAARFAAALEAAARRWPGLRHVAFGDLLLADVRAWRESLCASVGWSALFPLFGRDTTAVARAMIAAGLRAHLCCVDTARLDAGYAGRAFDAPLLAALPPETDPCGEHGEFHTCVSDGPMFAKPLALRKGETVLRDARFAWTDFRLT